MMTPGRANTPGALPPGFIHVDLDGLWTLAGAYGFTEKAYGDSFQKDLVFEIGVARLLELFAGLDIRATFFIVGRDLENEMKRARVLEISKAGHALANHTYHHRLDLERMPEDELLEEIVKTSDAVERVCGRQPIGFRAPGYGAGMRTLHACSRAGLRYDGSCMPTWWGGVLRQLANGVRRKVQIGEGNEIKEVSGSDLQYGGIGITGKEPILRLPLAVSPILRLPLHASLGMLMGADAVCGGLRRLARRGEPVTYLLHGLDVIGREDLTGRIPKALLKGRGFSSTTAQKQIFLKLVLQQMRESTEIQTTEDWLR